MFNYCTKCGNPHKSELGVCENCSMQAEPKIEPQPVQQRPFAEETKQQDYTTNFTEPFDMNPQTQPIQPIHTQHNLQQISQCPHCGGAGGIYPKSVISTPGFVYMGIMIFITTFFFVIFFPCAIIPFALIFLMFLFKDKYFACVNCGQRVS